MITSRACDLCTGPLQAEVVRLTLRAGEVVFLVQQRWRIQARPAGLQVMTICLDCHGYLAAAVQYLAQELGAGTPDPSRSADGDIVAA
ncbi:MAG: hypothetical protein M0R73_01355 [Dehalococcoidia bacterium]|nr:hypothetical protein [Dehalococcoidia bacterium]